MLTKRIIACLDVHAGRVVKGVQFVDLVDAGDPATQAARHAREGADEIVLLDITATHEGRQTLLDTVRRTARELFVPFCVGGGIKSARDAEQVFEAGADKVSINSAALADPTLISAIGASFGAQAVVVAIDARRDPEASDPVRDAQVHVHGGRRPIGRTVVEWAREAEQRGAGEILLTSMDSDGTRAGFDCELTAAVSEAVGIPVIASGGAGTVAHFADVFGRGKADAALAASIFHFGVSTRAIAQRRACAGRRSGEAAMLIPSIDLMGGRIVQLVQGEKLRLAFDDFEYWIEKFSRFPLVQLIDLDAAMRQGDNSALVEQIAKRLPCQAGGGIHTIDRARQVFDAGAKRVIIGSALFSAEGAVNTAFAAELADSVGAERVVAGIDTKNGRIAVKGWKAQVELTPDEAIPLLEPYAAAFLYTHVDGEGMMQGFPIETAARLRKLTQRQLIVAGGIRSQQEVDALHAIGADAVVGMAVYTEMLAV